LSQSVRCSRAYHAAPDDDCIIIIHSYEQP
jgi:hypothetical protein